MAMNNNNEDKDDALTAGGHAVSVRHVHGADADAGRHQSGRVVDVLGVGLHLAFSRRTASVA